MNRRRRNRGPFGFIRAVYSFGITWAILSFILPVFTSGGFLGILGLSMLTAYFVGKKAGRNESRETSGNAGARKEGTSGWEYEKNSAAGTKYASERLNRRPSAENGSSDSAADGTYGKSKTESSADSRSGGDAYATAGFASRDGAAYASGSARSSTVKKKSYGPEIDPIVEEGSRAMSEMGRLYMSIKDPEVRSKINEIIRITDKITQDAIDDPSDIPQIKKFFRYYLPTTIKLLNSYDRMASQGIEGENIDKSMKNITDMLDVAIEAYKKRLDSLFEDQALDIETDIDVMNQMLASEGLAGDRDFIVSNGKSFGTSPSSTGKAGKSSYSSYSKSTAGLNSDGKSAGAAAAQAPGKIELKL